MILYEVMITKDELSVGEKIYTNAPEHVINERVREMQQQWNYSDKSKEMLRSFSVRIIPEGSVMIQEEDLL